MINQSSIKYISQLLNRPDSITDGDHSSVALFRQTFPYFVPARYIQAAEAHKKAAYSPRMLSEIQPYMGNWLLLCNFLEAGRTGTGRITQEATTSWEKKPETKTTINFQPSYIDNRVTEKKNVEPASQRAQEVRPPYNAEPVAVEAELKVTPPAPSVVPEVRTVPVAEVVKPVVPEAKIVTPPVVIPEVNEELPVEVLKPVAQEVKAPPVVLPVAPEVWPEPKAEPTNQVVAEVRTKQPLPPVAPEVKTVRVEEQAKPIAAEVKAAPQTPVAAEIKAEQPYAANNAVVPEAVKPVAAEANAAPPVLAVAPEIKAAPTPEPAKIPATDVKAPAYAAPVVPEKIKEIPVALTKEQQAALSRFIPSKVIIEKQIEVAEEQQASETKPEVAVAASVTVDLADFVEEAVNAREKEKLIFPVYTEDYFLQQGLKVSPEIPEGIDDFKEIVEVDDEDKSLMVMMSFTEWLLHFKSTAEKQKDEKKDQKALKTMWQKEKLAAAMEEENEEIPENVFEMAVNSITKEDGLASESLADIYIKQGRYDQAIEMYRKLSLRNPKKNAYFARRIEEVLKEKQS